MPYLGDVRSSKAAFELPSILSFVKQTVASTVAKQGGPETSSWEVVSQSIMQLVQETNKLLPLASEPENVTKRQ
jgi:dynactin 1